MSMDGAGDCGCCEDALPTRYQAAFAYWWGDPLTKLDGTPLNPDFRYLVQIFTWDYTVSLYGAKQHDGPIKTWHWNEWGKKTINNYTGDETYDPILGSGTVCPWYLIAPTELPGGTGTFETLWFKGYDCSPMDGYVWGPGISIDQNWTGDPSAFYINTATQTEFYWMLQMWISGQLATNAMNDSSLPVDWYKDEGGTNKINECQFILKAHMRIRYDTSINYSKTDFEADFAALNDKISFTDISNKSENELSKATDPKVIAELVDGDPRFVRYCDTIYFYSVGGLITERNYYGLYNPINGTVEINKWYSEKIGNGAESALRYANLNVLGNPDWGIEIWSVPHSMNLGGWMPDNPYNEEHFPVFYLISIKGLGQGDLYIPVGSAFTKITMLPISPLSAQVCFERLAQDTNGEFLTGKVTYPNKGYNGIEVDCRSEPFILTENVTEGGCPEPEE